MKLLYLLAAFIGAGLAQQGGPLVTNLPPNRGGSGTSVDIKFLPGANGSVGSTPLNLAISGSPQPYYSVGGTNGNVIGILIFTNGISQSAWGNFPIPSVVPSSLTVEIKWYTADNTSGHNVIWNFNTACSSTSVDPALSNANTVTTIVPATASQMTTSTITLTPSCSPGDQAFFSLIGRGDTETANAVVNLVSLRIHS